MSNISVKSIGNFLSSAASTRAASKVETGAETFDETFNSLKTDGGNKTQLDKAEVNRPDDSSHDADVKKLDSPAKRDAIKKEQEPTDEQMAAMAEEVASQIKEAIQEKFDVSEEELSAVMDSLGISDENLLDVSSLTKLVMKLDGVENQADILTNPDFAKDLKDILAAVEEIKQEVSVNVTDVDGATEVQSEVNVQENQSDVNAADEMLQTEEQTTSAEDVEMQSEETEQQVKTTEATTVEADGNSQQTGDNQSDGLLKHDSSASNKGSANNVDSNQAIQLQDFAARLTEDLSGRVGEEQATEIVRQVVEQVQVQAKQGMKSMEMQLYPEHLGKVLIQVVSKDGAVTAQITAETEAAKNALESQLTILKENLSNQGVKIENVEVTIASHAFEQNMQGETQQEQNSGNSRRGRRAERILNEGLMDELQEEPEIMEFRGNTVSYSA